MEEEEADGDRSSLRASNIDAAVSAAGVVGAAADAAGGSLFLGSLALTPPPSPREGSLGSSRFKGTLSEPPNSGAGILMDRRSSSPEEEDGGCCCCCCAILLLGPNSCGGGGGGGGGVDVWEEGELSVS